MSTLEIAERAHIMRALQAANWIIGGPQGAAAKLGMKRTTLQSRMQKLSIVRPQPSRTVKAPLIPRPILTGADTNTFPVVRVARSRPSPQRGTRGALTGIRKLVVL